MSFHTINNKPQIILVPNVSPSNSNNNYHISSLYHVEHIQILAFRTLNVKLHKKFQVKLEIKLISLK